MRMKLIVTLLLMTGFSSLAVDKKPNVLLILADDLGYNDLGFQGSKEMKTPHLDKLASESIKFSNGYVSASTCSPSRAGLMTGRYQQRFGHEANCPPKDKGMDLSQKTIADRMRAAGYRTGIIGKWHLGDADEFHPNKRGFDYFYGLRHGSRGYNGNGKPGKGSKAIEENMTKVGFKGYVTDVFGQKAIDFINKDDDKPFFLYLSFTAPHAPMNAKKEDLPLFEHIENKKRRTLAAMIWAMDRAIGKVLKTLEDKGIADNTIIWFLSDNGGAKANSSNNYPLAGNKGIKFEGGHHVPFIMKWKKKFPKPFTYDKPVISLDILPTSVSAAGGKFGEIDGVNLLDKVTDNNVTPHQNLYWHKLWFSAMREGDWKIIYVEDYGYALYNLKADLGEKHNLAKQHPERLASMKKVLNAWKGELTEPLWREASKWKKVHGKEQIDLIEGKNKK